MIADSSKTKLFTDGTTAIWASESFFMSRKSSWVDKTSNTPITRLNKRVRWVVISVNSIGVELCSVTEKISETIFLSHHINFIYTKQEFKSLLFAKSELLKVASSITILLRFRNKIKCWVAGISTIKWIDSVLSIKYVKLNNEVESLNKEIGKLEEENINLKNEIDSLKKEIPAKIEQIAREKYDMIKEGEKIIEVKKEDKGENKE